MEQAKRLGIWKTLQRWDFSFSRRSADYCEKMIGVIANHLVVIKGASYREESTWFPHQAIEHQLDIWKTLHQ